MYLVIRFYKVDGDRKSSSKYTIRTSMCSMNVRQVQQIYQMLKGLCSKLTLVSLIDLLKSCSCTFLIFPLIRVPFLYQIGKTIKMALYIPKNYPYNKLQVLPMNAKKKKPSVFVCWFLTQLELRKKMTWECREPKKALWSWQK